jgi:hypothetical protein
VNTDALISLAAAAVSAIAAAGSWFAALKANSAAGKLSAIEGHRRRGELTPQFTITATTRATAPDTADLRVVLSGPDELDWLDPVTIRILDERWRDHGTSTIAGSPTPEQVAKVLYGPWEFNPGASAQVISNRETRPRRYERSTGQDWDFLVLQPARPPAWAGSVSPQQWLEQFAGQPIRLLLTCHHGDYTWSLPYDVFPVKEDQGASALETQEQAAAPAADQAPQIEA